MLNTSTHARRVYKDRYLLIRLMRDTVFGGEIENATKTRWSEVQASEDRPHTLFAFSVTTTT